MKRKSSTKIHPLPKPTEQLFCGRTFKELRELVKPISDDDPNVYTSKELMAFWDVSQDKTLEMLKALAELGLCEAVWASRKVLHGQTKVKAYRLKGDSDVVAS